MMHPTQGAPRRCHTIKQAARPMLGAWQARNGLNAADCAGSTCARGRGLGASYLPRHRPHHDD